jgi:hypothetical protein
MTTSDGSFARVWEYPPSLSKAAWPVRSRRVHKLRVLYRPYPAAALSNPTIQLAFRIDAR